MIIDFFNLYDVIWNSNRPFCSWNLHLPHCWRIFQFHFDLDDPRRSTLIWFFVKISQFSDHFSFLSFLQFLRPYLKICHSQIIYLLCKCLMLEQFFIFNLILKFAPLICFEQFLQNFQFLIVFSIFTLPLQYFTPIFTNSVLFICFTLVCFSVAFFKVCRDSLYPHQIIVPIFALFKIVIHCFFSTFERILILRVGAPPHFRFFRVSSFQLGCS